MKIAIYHPQLNTFGGGELIALVIASELSKEHDVELISPANVNKKELENFFDIDLSKVNIRGMGSLMKFIYNLPTLKTFKHALYVRKMMSIKGYDLIFDTGTNGLFFRKLKEKTACYINFTTFTPFKKGLKGILNFLLINPKKAYKYDLIISNSNFTRRAVKSYSGGKDSIVINPPVRVDEIKPSKNKKNYILNVGRFSKEKKQGILIEAFKKAKLDGWELHLIGQFMPGYDEEYFESLKKSAKGYSIVFHTNMKHEDVLKFVGKCKLYWHSRGYGETDAMEMENFGMTTVEAMAGGCVPLVINKGAQPDIVDHKKNGFVWAEPDELINYTIKLIDDKKLMKNLSKEAIEKSKKYTSERFKKGILKNIDHLFK